MRIARRFALAALALVPLAFLAAARFEAGARLDDGAAKVAALPRTLVLVRHAEKDSAGDPKNPGLSEAGRVRAASLAKLLAHARVARVFASDLRRTQDTAAAFAKDRSLTVEVLPATKPKEWAAAIETLRAGEVGLAVGHSNTLPAIARSFGVDLERLVEGAGGKQLADDEYGRVFVITLPPAGAAVAPSCIELAY